MLLLQQYSRYSIGTAVRIKLITTPSWTSIIIIVIMCYQNCELGSNKESYAYTCSKCTFIHNSSSIAE